MEPESPWRKKKSLLDKLMDSMETVLGTATTAVELYLSDHPDIVDALKPYLLRADEEARIAVDTAKAIKNVRILLREQRLEPGVAGRAAALAQEALELLRRGLPRNAYQKVKEAELVLAGRGPSYATMEASYKPPIVGASLQGVISAHRKTMREPVLVWDKRGGNGVYRDVSWSSGGLLAVAAGSVAVYKGDGRLLWETSAPAHRVSWGPEGGMLASIDSGGSLRVYTVDGTLVWSGKPGGGAVSLSWNPLTGISGASREGVVEHYGPDGEILWSARTGLSVNEIAWNPGGDLLAVGGAEGDIALFRAPGEGLEEYWRKRVGSKIRGLAWSPDGRLLALSAGKRLIVLTGDGVPVWSAEPARGGEAVAGLAWSPDGNLLAAAIASGFGERGLGSPTGRFLVYSREGHLLWESPVVGASGRRLAWGLGGSYLAVAHWDGVRIYRVSCGCLGEMRITDPLLEGDCASICGVITASLEGVKPLARGGAGWSLLAEIPARLREGSYTEAAFSWERSRASLGCRVPGAWGGECGLLWEAGELFWLGLKAKASRVAYRLGVEPEALYALAKPRGGFEESRRSMLDKIDSIDEMLSGLPARIVGRIAGLLGVAKDLDELKGLIRVLHDWTRHRKPPLEARADGNACNRGPLRVYVKTGSGGFYIGPGECSKVPPGSRLSIPGIPELPLLEYSPSVERGSRVKGFPDELAGMYEPLEYLGGGGMASVWLVKRLSDGMVYALKHPINKRLWKRLVEEAVFWKTLVHPNIVRLHDYFLEPIPHILMEPVEGVEIKGKKARSLRDLLDLLGRIPPLSATLIAIAVARGLRHAHSKGIAHLDIKPSNVLLSPGPVAKLSDWGISRLYQSDRASIPGVSPLYASPEQLSLEYPPGPESDVYQLGLLMVEMLTGEPKRDSGGLPRILSSVVAGCLEKEPERRPGIDVVESQLFEAARVMVFTSLPEDLALAASLRGLAGETVSPENILPSHG